MYKRVVGICLVLLIVAFTVPLFAQRSTGQGELKAGSQQEDSLMQEIRKLSASLVEADSAEEKKTITSNIKSELEKLFDARTVRREVEITRLEKQISKLRELNKVRQAKRSDLIELKLKLIVNEASGVGF